MPSENVQKEGTVQSGLSPATSVRWTGFGLSILFGGWALVFYDQFIDLIDGFYDGLSALAWDYPALDPVLAVLNLGDLPVILLVCWLIALAGVCLGFALDQSDNRRKPLAAFTRWTGYSLSFGVGAVLWSYFIWWGHLLENANFLLAFIFSFCCLPLTMGICLVISAATMKLSGFIDREQSRDRIKANIQKAAVIGILTTLGSCGMTAIGVEPPEPVRSIYPM